MVEHGIPKPPDGWKIAGIVHHWLDRSTSNIVMFYGSGSTTTASGDAAAVRRVVESHGFRIVGDARRFAQRLPYSRAWDRSDSFYVAERDWTLAP